MSTEAAIIWASLGADAVVILGAAGVWSLFYFRGWRIMCPAAPKRQPEAAAVPEAEPVTSKPSLRAS